MDNDRLQGILFDQPERLDLLNRKRRDRFMRKVVAARQDLKNRRSQASKPKTTPTHKASDRGTSQYIIPKNLNKKKYEAAISDLYGRFKTTNT